MEPNKAGVTGWLQSDASMPWAPKPTPMPAPMPKPPVIELPEKPEHACGDMVLAMSYVKMQDWKQTYEPETALERGTVFPDLDLPFVGEGACRDE